MSPPILNIYTTSDTGELHLSIDVYFLLSDELHLKIHIICLCDALRFVLAPFGFSLLEVSVHNI